MPIPEPEPANIDASARRGKAVGKSFQHERLHRVDPLEDGAASSDE